MKCTACGIESPDASAFTQAGQELLCPRCWKRREVRDRNDTERSLLQLLVLGVIFLVFLPGTRTGWFVFNIVIVAFFCAVGVVLHELGHAVAGLLGGLRPMEISLGEGPIRARFRLLGVVVRVRSFPLGGRTLVLPRQSGPMRWRLALCTLGGPLTNLLLLLAAWPLLGDEDLSQRFRPVTREVAPIQDWMGAQAILFAFSFVPYRSKGPGAAASNDGAALLREIFGSEAQFSELHSVHYLLLAAEALDNREYDRAARICEQGLERHPGEAPLLHVMGVALVELGQPARGRALVEQSRRAAKEILPPHEDARLAGLIAYAAACEGGQDLVRYADALSYDALRTAPWEQFLQVVRGYVLVEQGRADEALPLLDFAFRWEDERPKKAGAAAFLAHALRKLGRLQEGQTWAETARALDPECTELRRLGL